MLLILGMLGLFTTRTRARGGVEPYLDFKMGPRANTKSWRHTRFVLFVPVAQPISHVGAVFELLLGTVETWLEGGGGGSPY
jgi:hypothetical protein